MMPDHFPAPGELVWISGTPEVLGGQVLYPGTRVLGGWGLILPLPAVFPASLSAALHGWPGMILPPWILWLRVPGPGRFRAFA